MPQTHQLMKDFTDDDVVFLNVNVHDDMSNWKNFVTKEKMPGAHVFASQEQSDSLYTAFNFNGIPHYVLIDAKSAQTDPPIPV
jgi:hypothetical protein